MRGCNRIVEAAKRAGTDRSRSPRTTAATRSTAWSARLIDDGAIGTPRLMIETSVGGRDRIVDHAVAPHEADRARSPLDAGVHNADILRYYLGEVRSVYGEIAPPREGPPQHRLGRAGRLLRPLGRRTSRTPSSRPARTRCTPSSRSRAAPSASGPTTTAGHGQPLRGRTVYGSTRLAGVPRRPQRPADQAPPGRRHGRSTTSASWSTPRATASARWRPSCSAASASGPTASTSTTPIARILALGVLRAWRVHPDGRPARGDRRGGPRRRRAGLRAVRGRAARAPGHAGRPDRRPRRRLPARDRRDARPVRDVRWVGACGGGSLTRQLDELDEGAEQSIGFEVGEPTLAIGCRSRPAWITT